MDTHTHREKHRHQKQHQGQQRELLIKTRPKEFVLAWNIFFLLTAGLYRHSYNNNQLGKISPHLLSFPLVTKRILLRFDVIQHCDRHAVYERIL